MIHNTYNKLLKYYLCYKLKTLELVSEGILYWVNIRELNRELYTELSTLYTKHQWSMLYYLSSITLAYSK